VTIEIDGKKVPLGIPGAPRPTDAKIEPEAYPLIPLRRGGTADDAAGSVLLYVLFCVVESFLTIYLAWHRHSRRMSLDIRWKLLEGLAFKK
jgi:hypothetical protein